MLCASRSIVRSARSWQKSVLQLSARPVRAFSQTTGMIGEVQKKDELVQIVDENDVEVRGARRQEMRELKLIHR